MNDLYKYCLQIADNSFILNHRLGEYCGKGPFLEEDLAITNTALDHIGLAEALYTYAASISNKDETADSIAFRRSENDYVNVCLVEQENIDFAFITTRQFFFDVFQFNFLTELKESKDETLAALAVKSLKEVTYHLRKSSEWMIRLGQGTEVSKSKMQEAIDSLWMFVPELFLVQELDQKMLDQGIGADLNKIKDAWDAKVSEIFEMASLEIPTRTFTVPVGKSGQHTEKLGYMLTNIQYLQNKYPDATW
jgi:ring-1,2-phenylacetyl-CoA epoxidase subunit PaaC